jgi:hypothetical protein
LTSTIVGTIFALAVVVFLYEILTELRAIRHEIKVALVDLESRHEELLQRMDGLRCNWQEEPEDDDHNPWEQLAE